MIDDVFLVVSLGEADLLNVNPNGTHSSFNRGEKEAKKRRKRGEKEAKKRREAFYPKSGDYPIPADMNLTF